MDTTISDEKPQVDSSPTDEKPGEASSASKDGKQETPLSIAMAAAGSSASTDKDKSGQKESQEKAALAPESGSGTEHDKDEAEKPEGEEEKPTDGVEEEEQEEVKEDEVKQDDAPEGQDDKLEQSFQQSKRFQELTTKVKDLEPLARQASTINDYCEKNGISGEQLRDALYVAGLMNDPGKVDELKRIMTPFFDSLGFASGERLPEDLQKDVNEGVMSVDRARELARYRAQTQMQGQMQKNAQARQSQQQVQAALSSWEQSKEKTDPDWKKRIKVTNAFYAAKIQAHQGLPSAQDHVRYAEEAYQEAKTESVQFLAKPAPRKVLRTNGSHKQTKVSPKTPLEAAMAVANGQKLNFQ